MTLKSTTCSCFIAALALGVWPLAMADLALDRRPPRRDRVHHQCLSGAA